MAHEINNPLEAMTNFLYLACGDPNLSPDTREYLEGAEREIKRLATIARHTLGFARLQSSEPSVDPLAVAEGVLSMFQARCRSRGGELRFTPVASAETAISADELRQILVNLLANSCDAIGGRQGLVELRLSIARRETLTIAVLDTGLGISASDLPCIFEPFFTTKEDFGTGIGLWVTKELVERRGGTIRAESGEHLHPFNTAFTVELPLVSAAAELPLGELQAG